MFHTEINLLSSNIVFRYEDIAKEELDFYKYWDHRYNNVLSEFSTLGLIIPLLLRTSVMPILTKKSLIDSRFSQRDLIGIMVCLFLLKLMSLQVKSDGTKLQTCKGIYVLINNIYSL